MAVVQSSGVAPKHAACMRTVCGRRGHGLPRSDTARMPVKQEQPQPVVLHRGLVRRRWRAVLELRVHHGCTQHINYEVYVINSTAVHIYHTSTDCPELKQVVPYRHKDGEVARKMAAVAGRTFCWAPPHPRRHPQYRASYGTKVRHGLSASTPPRSR